MPPAFIPFHTFAEPYDSYSIAPNVDVELGAVGSQGVDYEGWKFALLLVRSEGGHGGVQAI